MEIHSAWGTFEWLLTDGFPLGHRSGVGKVRHMEAKFLWLQSYVKKNEVELGAIAADDNPADVGTKELTEARMKYLLSKLSYGERIF